MRLFRIISGITLLLAGSWLTPLVIDLFGEQVGPVILPFLAGMMVYSGLPFVGQKSVKFKGI